MLDERYLRMVTKSNIKSNKKTTNKSSLVKVLDLRKKGGVSKSKTKAKSKSTKHKIEKLNADLNEINEIQQLLGGDKSDSKKINPLDSKLLKEGLKKDEEKKVKDKLVENDIKSQMDMIAEMGF